MTPEPNDVRAAEALWAADWSVGQVEPDEVLTIFARHFAAHRQAERERIATWCREQMEHHRQAILANPLKVHARDNKESRSLIAAYEQLAAELNEVRDG